MKEQLEKIRLSALEALDGAATPAALEELRVKIGRASCKERV